jgi:hypothetical protein
MLLELHFYGPLLFKIDEERTNEIKQVITLLCTENKTVYHTTLYFDMHV